MSSESQVVLRVKDLSKQYRLGQWGTGTLSHDLNRWWHKVRGKEDPYLKVGDVNDRTAKGGSEYVWSLKDINFDLCKGEVLGIIGRNGAGKSTLLKILSQVTTPTTGTVQIKGRIASLLEVGTGFHPELTGRENVFLNGAILGMSKAEIRSKLDQIIDFSGVARYIDTPVKRYSSGMMVRLGFAVAAHLEPEILIVDEVLAVGDAEFQKKCLGKMKEVGGQGRTVLFVSHNMPSIRMLCDKVMYLNQGMVKRIGKTDDVIGEYLASESYDAVAGDDKIPPNLSSIHTGEAKFLSMSILGDDGTRISRLDFMEYFRLRLTLKALRDLSDVFLSVFIVNQYGERVMMIVQNAKYKPFSLKSGEHEIIIKVSERLMPGSYSFGLSLSYYHTGNAIDRIESFYPFSVDRESVSRNVEYPWSTVHGYIMPESEWEIKTM